MSDDCLPPLREVIAAHGLRARKALGQNFLLDLNLTRKIARAAGPLEGRTVIEVGPGPGGLTRALLLEGARKVVAIERDARALPALEEIARRWPGRLDIIHADALKQDFSALANQAGQPVKIVANLPYNIATPLLSGWLETRPWPPFWDSLTLMFQREVAARITAPPRTKAYGRLSILAQWRTRAEILFDIPPSAFVPPPKVFSSVVHITPLSRPVCECSLETLKRLTAAAFNQRRKMLRKALKTLGNEAVKSLERAGIDGTRRAEELEIAEICRLAQVMENHA